MYRSAARVLLFDDEDRLLLARGHDADDPGRSWWFTIGGGIDPGESPREAAVREVDEETGMRLDPAGLVGPVLRRRARFDFFAETVRQDEDFFLARADGETTLSRAGWTAIERDFMDELRWWPLGELSATAAEVFPHGLPTLAARLARGWDGTLIHLADDNDDQRPAPPGGERRHGPSNG
nr:NUDIX domain-containing protein [Pseudactinotalea sp. HY160]